MHTLSILIDRHYFCAYIYKTMYVYRQSEPFSCTHKLLINTKLLPVRSQNRNSASLVGCLVKKFKVGEKQFFCSCDAHDLEISRLFLEKITQPLPYISWLIIHNHICISFSTTNNNNYIPINPERCASEE